MAPRARDLTICSISFRSSAYLELNHRLTLELNPGDPLGTWLVIENSPEGDAARVPIQDPRFEVHPGVDLSPDEKGAASYHHGRALNRALQLVKTQFVLILDPDFFLIRRGWIVELMSHMVANRLTFLGAPWHPRWYTKWRYFPSPHCMLVDLSRVELCSLNYEPDMAGQPSPFRSELLTKLARLLSRAEFRDAAYYCISNLGMMLREERRQREAIGTSRDTGVRIFEKYSQHQKGVEVFKPVYRPAAELLVPSVPGRSLWRKLDLINRESRRFVPKRRGYFSQKGFRDFGQPDVRGLGWEEFLWRGKPLGFHVRRGKKDELQQKKDVEMAREVVSALRASHVSDAGAQSPR